MKQWFGYHSGIISAIWLVLMAGLVLWGCVAAYCGWYGYWANVLRGVGIAGWIGWVIGWFCRRLW